MQETKDISPYKQGLRDKIIISAMMAFAKKGIRQVKMDDVASELGISKRTLSMRSSTKKRICSMRV